MMKLGRILGICGLVSLLSVPLTLFLWDWELTGLAIAKLVFGVGAVAFWITSNLGEIRQTFQGRTAFYGSFSALFLVLLVAGIGIANYFVHQFPAWVDLTEEKIHSLSAQSRDVLDNLQDDVDVLAFYGASEAEYQQVRDVLERYRSVSARFAFELVDPVLRLDLVEQHKIQSRGPRILVRTRGREERVKLQDLAPGGLEEAITGALLQVTKPAQESRVCLTTGHGELALQGDDPGGVLSLFARDLQSEGHQAQAVSLLEQPSVPAVCRLLIVAGAKQDLTEGERRSLRTYLQSGGKLLVFLGASDTSTLGPLLRGFGILVGDNTLVAPESRNPLAVITEPTLYPATHPIFSRFFQGSVVMLNELQAVFPLARSVKATRSPPEDLLAVELAASSSQAWAESDRLQDGKQVTFDADRDLAGPVPLAVAVEQRSRGLRLAAFGSSGFVADSAYRIYGFNRDICMNTVAWLLHQEKQITVRPRFREASLLRLSPGQLKFITFFCSDVLPLLILAIGITVWQVRRWS